MLLRKHIGLIFFTASMAILGACNFMQKSNSNFFLNDMEAELEWEQYNYKENSKKINMNNAKSGQFVSQIDSANNFSPALSIGFNELKNNKIYLLRASAYFWLTTNCEEAILVIEITNSNSELIDKASKSTLSTNAKKNRWVKVSLNYDLTLNDLNQSNNRVKIYAINEKPFPAYVDDIEIIME